MFWSTVFPVEMDQGSCTFFSDFDRYCYTVLQKGTIASTNWYCYSSVRVPTLCLSFWQILASFLRQKYREERHVVFWGYALADRWSSVVLCYLSSDVSLSSWQAAAGSMWREERGWEIHWGDKESLSAGTLFSQPPRTTALPLWRWASTCAVHRTQTDWATLGTI